MRFRAFIFAIVLACLPSVHAQQAIDKGWLDANAAAFGGDPTRGPWVLGRAFPGHPLPAADDGLYPYVLSSDVSSDSTAFVASGPVKLDLAGHAITFDNAEPVTFNGEFENEANPVPAG